MRLSSGARRRRRALRRPAVEAVEPRGLLSSGSIPGLGGTPFDPIVEASAARAAFGVNGSGLAAAVIDTGVNYNHEALGGGIGPGKKVEGGWNFAANSADPNATASQHGTAVAGLLASRDPADLGVAPAAGIVALRVFDDSGSSDFNKIADALQWVIDHHDQYHITVVNVSISDGQNYSMDWFSQDGGIGQRIEGLVQQLDALDIPVVAATGNSFTGQQGEGFIAILPGTIRVTATDASDHLASDAQRLGPIAGRLATDLAAPGVGLEAPVAGNGFAEVDGTSFAAPQVSGAIVLLQQIYESRFGHLPSVSDLDTWLKDGAKPVVDPVTGITIGRLDILKSAELIPGGSPSAPAGSPARNPTKAPATPPAPTTRSQSTAKSPSFSVPAPGVDARFTAATNSRPTAPALLPFEGRVVGAESLGYSSAAFEDALMARRKAIHTVKRLPIVAPLVRTARAHHSASLAKPRGRG